jgi:hypothetical protein
VVFLDDLGRKLFRVDNVFITLHLGSNRQHLLPSEFDLGHFMLDLTTSPLTQANAIWCRVPVYITPNIDNCAINVIAPPHDTASPSAARMRVLGTTGGARPHSYYLYGYIGNLLYYFKFDAHRTMNNVILADPTHGSLHLHFEAILQAQDLPSYGVTNWTLFQREDALNGNGGGVMSRA